MQLLQPVGDRDGSHVRWANEPNGDIVIFVHGFIGNAVETWVNFPVMVAARLEKTDVLFFGHNGGTSQIPATVAALSECIEQLWSDPNNFSGFPAERAKFRYKRIMLCCHSMGCVVARDAVVAAAESKLDWAKHAWLLLFAPAHKGIFDSLLRAEMFAKVLGIVSSLPMEAFYWRYPAVQALRPKSDYLEDLEKRTNRLSKNEVFGPHVIAKGVVFGEKDKTVEQRRFSIDPYPPRTFKGHTHKSVCKPKPLLFEGPYDELAKRL
jgi:pimeloyl-ACP methyl ester carboxylesterase